MERYECLKWKNNTSNNSELLWKQVFFFYLEGNPTSNVQYCEASVCIELNDTDLKSM